MALKKNRMASLISGIIDKPEERKTSETIATMTADPTPTAPTPEALPEDETRVSPDLCRELGIAPEVEEQLNEIRRRKVGRPNGRKNGNPTPRENRATFVISRDLTLKLKYVSLMERRLYKDVVSEALSAYVEEWEKKHGAINLPNETER